MMPPLPVNSPFTLTPESVDRAEGMPTATGPLD
jgi:hypothetical protein